MSYFPMFVDLKEKHCLVIGGGTVACRKVRTLLLYEATITVIAPCFIKELEEMGEQHKITLIKKEIKEDTIVFEREHIALVICATNQRNVNEAVALWCQKEHIQVNVVDNQELCTFFFPAVVKKGDVSIGITTSGVSPSGSSYLREQIEQLVDEQFLSFLEEMTEYREWLKVHVKQEEERRKRLLLKWKEWKTKQITKQI